MFTICRTTCVLLLAVTVGAYGAWCCCFVHSDGQLPGEPESASVDCCPLASAKPAPATCPPTDGSAPAGQDKTPDCDCQATASEALPVQLAADHAGAATSPTLVGVVFDLPVAPTGADDPFVGNIHDPPGGNAGYGTSLLSLHCLLTT